jgi:hypothetical protein
LDGLSSLYNLATNQNAKIARGRWNLALANAKIADLHLYQKVPLLVEIINP